MFKRNKRIATYFLALGIVLAQCSVVLAEVKHPFHQPDAKCSVCLVSDHFSHALVYIPPLQHFAQAVSQRPIEDAVFFTTSFDLRYFIRAPPSF